MFQRFAFLPVHQPVAGVIENQVISTGSIPTNKLHVYFTFPKRAKDHSAEMRACVVHLCRRAEGQPLRRGRTEEHLHHGALSDNPPCQNIETNQINKSVEEVMLTMGKIV